MPLPVSGIRAKVGNICRTKREFDLKRINRLV